MLQIGKPAPAFTLPDQDDKKHSLKDYQGSWVLVYFYPTDDTPGCTKEACGVRDNLPNFKKLKAVVLGVSKDTVKSHKKFVDKYKLNFTLLADPEHAIIEKYDAWQEKKFMGKTYMGTVRSSVLINPEGKIAKIYPKVKPEEHAEEVLEDLKKLK